MYVFLLGFLCLSWQIFALDEEEFFERLENEILVCAAVPSVGSIDSKIVSDSYNLLLQKTGSMDKDEIAHHVPTLYSGFCQWLGTDDFVCMQERTEDFLKKNSEDPLTLRSWQSVGLVLHCLHSIFKDRSFAPLYEAWNLAYHDQGAEHSGSVLRWICAEISFFVRFYRENLDTVFVVRHEGLDGHFLVLQQGVYPFQHIINCKKRLLNQLADVVPLSILKLFQQCQAHSFFAKSQASKDTSEKRYMMVEASTLKVSWHTELDVRTRKDAFSDLLSVRSVDRHFLTTLDILFNPSASNNVRLCVFCKKYNHSDSCMASATDHLRQIEEMCANFEKLDLCVQEGNYSKASECLSLFAIQPAKNVDEQTLLKQSALVAARIFQAFSCFNEIHVLDSKATASCKKLQVTWGKKVQSFLDFYVRESKEFKSEDEFLRALCVCHEASNKKVRAAYLEKKLADTDVIPFFVKMYAPQKFLDDFIASASSDEAVSLIRFFMETQGPFCYFDKVLRDADQCISDLKKGSVVQSYDLALYVLLCLDHAMQSIRSHTHVKDLLNKRDEVLDAFKSFQEKEVRVAESAMKSAGLSVSHMFTEPFQQSFLSFFEKDSRICGRELVSEVANIVSKKLVCCAS